MRILVRNDGAMFAALNNTIVRALHPRRLRKGSYGKNEMELETVIIKLHVC
jgi:hypothetical protein